MERASSVADQQLSRGKDFIIELPHGLSGLQTRSKELAQLLSRKEVTGRVNKTYNPIEQKSRMTWWLTSSEDLAESLDGNCKHNDTATAMLLGFGTLLSKKDPNRVAFLLRSLDVRIRGAGSFADEQMVALSDHLGKDLAVYGIFSEPGQIPEAGIEFEIPDDLKKSVTKPLLSSLRRLHINSGHPPNAELERIIRLSGGSEVARACVRGLNCSACRKNTAPKAPRPGNVEVFQGGGLFEAGQGFRSDLVFR